MKHFVMLALLGLTAVPLAAQYRPNSGVINHPGGEVLGEPSRNYTREPRDAVSSVSPAASIRRAGQWGRCVVARDRAAAVAFATVTRAAATKLRQRNALAGTFNACRRQSGDFALRDRVSIQQAAIRDALRAS